MLVTSKHTERNQPSGRRAAVAYGIAAAVQLIAAMSAPWFHSLEVTVGKARYSFDAMTATAGDDTPQGFSEYEVRDLRMVGHCRTWRLGNLEWRFWVDWSDLDPRPRWFN